MICKLTLIMITPLMTLVMLSEGDVGGRLKTVIHESEILRETQTREKLKLLYEPNSIEKNILFLEGRRLCPSTAFVCYFRTYFCSVKTPDVLALTNPTPFNWFDYCIHYPSKVTKFFDFGSSEVTIVYNEEAMRMSLESFCRMFNPTTTPAPSVTCPPAKCPSPATTTAKPKETSKAGKAGKAEKAGKDEKDEKEKKQSQVQYIDLRWAAGIGGAAMGIVILLLIIIILCIRSSIAYKHMKKLSAYNKERTNIEPTSYKDPYGYPPYV